MNIVFCCDNNFMEHTCVSLVSLLETNKDAKVYIICDKISDENLSKINKIEAFFNASIFIVNINDIDSLKGIFDGLKTTKEWSSSMYFRYLVASVVKDSKAIYLDSDIIVKKNLAPLWNIDLGKSLAGVVPHPYDYDVQHGHYSIDEFDIYFNSGVMLINCDEWRNQDILDKLIKISKAIPDRFPDQDALNRVLNGKCIKISKLFNLMTNKQYGDYFYDEAFIIHYIQYPKPWTDHRKKFNRGYIEYVNKTNYILNKPDSIQIVTK